MKIKVCEAPKYADINKLKFHPKNENLRSITPERMADLKESIKKKGFYQPILVQKGTNYVLSGNHRLKALRELVAEGNILGEGLVPVVYENVTDEMAEAILHESNAQYANWVEERLRVALQEASAAGISTKEWGYSESEMARIMSSAEADAKSVLDPKKDEEEKKRKEETEDDVPEVEKNIFNVKRGQIWKLGDHRLMCGNSTNLEDVGMLMAGKKADMVFTDPPYGVDYQGGHNTKRREKIQNDGLQGHSLTDLFAGALKAACEFTHDHAAFYIWYADGKAVETFASFSKLPLKVRAVIAWYKVRSGLGAFMSQYIPNYEPCIYAFKEDCSPQWFGPSDEKTVWELQKELRNEFHPTQKPIALAERAISNSSQSGQIILDLFGGSGATLVACEKVGRKCRMMEIDEHYCSVIISRWQAYTGKKAVLEKAK